MNIENQELPKKTFVEILKKNQKKIIFCVILLILSVAVIFGFNEYKEKKNLSISQEFNQAKILIEKNNKEKALQILDNIILQNNKFYSPLSLNLITEKKLIQDTDKILSYFDIIISNSKLEKETKNLYIFKKIIFLGDSIDENVLLENLKPIIQSNSIWKNTVSKYISKYYSSKKEFNKAKEFSFNNN